MPPVRTNVKPGAALDPGALSTDTSVNIGSTPNPGKQLLAPSIEKARADPVLAGKCRRYDSRWEAGGGNLSLLLNRPRATAFASSDQFDPLCTCAHTIFRMSTRGTQLHIRHRAALHGQHASQSDRADQGAVAATLTLSLNRRRDYFLVYGKLHHSESQRRNVSLPYCLWSSDSIMAALNAAQS
jgi:hypothetical protein